MMSSSTHTPLSESQRRLGLIQLHMQAPAEADCETHRTAMIQAHEPYLQQAVEAGVQILCLQELCTGPYFAPSQDTKWYGLAERIPEGPTTQYFQAFAKQHAMVIILPIYEEAMPGLYYNTAVVIDADGQILGKYRKNHLPQVAGFWEKFFFRPGNLGYPVFDTAYGKLGVYICYDRHFPEGARALGLNGAEIVFNPSATVAGLSENLWFKEQVAHAIANGYFVAAINRVGTEAPWNIGHFYGQSYVVDPVGDILATAPRDDDALLVVDVDLAKVREIRNLWQFYRDRRTDTYESLVQP
ncbi:MAG: nitrilase-related carbon-nitrogen hydrolase [Vampirovibrionales bacterium]